MPAIKFYEIVREIVELEIRKGIDENRKTREECLDEIVKYSKLISSEWFSGRRPNIPYSIPFCRIAYIYECVGANANLIKHIFGTEEILINFIKKKNEEQEDFNVCVFGAGPGTELMGIAKMIEVNEIPKTYINFLLLDNEDSWGISWDALYRQINSRLRSSYGRRDSWPVECQGNFVRIDYFSIHEYTNVSSLFDKQDVFIFCYVLSEIFDYPLPDGFKALMSILCQFAKSGSLIIFIDRGPLDSKFGNMAEELLREIGITVLVKSNSNTDPETGNARMDNDERLSDLGLLDIELGVMRDKKARNSWNSFYIIGKKE